MTSKNLTINELIQFFEKKGETIIKNLLEDKNKPLSDLEIVKLLDTQDFSIARRTVAKYRESMNILNTKKRKLK